MTVLSFPAIATALGLDEGDRLLGFVYVRSPAPNTPGLLARPARQKFFKDWTG